MIRDFTDTSKNKLINYVKQVGDERDSNIFLDNIMDCIYNIEDCLGFLNLKGDLSNVDSYLKKVVDKNNTSQSELEKIFDDVYSVENMYKTYTENTKNLCKSFDDLIIKLSEIISPSNVSFTADSINNTLSTWRDEYVRLYVNHKIYADYEKNSEKNLAKDGILQQKDINDLSSEDKDYIIEYYEKFNSIDKAQVDKFLSAEWLTEQQVRDIKLILYSAKEPYRSMFITSLHNYTLVEVIGNKNNSEESKEFFSPSTDTIHVNIDSDINDLKGEYATLFHEGGHAIDYYFKDDFKYLTREYTNEKGQTLLDVIFDDVKNNIAKTINENTSDPQQQTNVLNYIMGAKSISIDTLTAEEKEVLDLVKKKYSGYLTGEDKAACSDVYGGITNNIIVGDHWHGLNSSQDKYYWYNEKGVITKNQPLELWAEYFSSQLRGDEEAIEQIQIFFPNASEFLKEIENQYK